MNAKIAIHATAITCTLPIMGAHRSFSRDRQIRGSGDERPPAGTTVRVWGRSPLKPMKNCKNNA